MFGRTKIFMAEIGRPIEPYGRDWSSRRERVMARKWGGCAICQMQRKVCTRVPPKFWNMPSERLTKCVAQADVVVSSLDETRNVGDRERIVESNLNISMVRPEGGEGIRSNLGPSF